MCKYTLVILLLPIILIHLDAQPQIYLYEIPNTISNRGWDVEILEDGFILATGTFYPSSTGDLAGGSTIIRADSEGRELWMKTFLDEEKPYRQGGQECLKQLSDGNFIIVGDRLTGEDSFEVFMMKPDDDGNILWETVFDSDHLQFARGVYELENGDLIINADGDPPFGQNDTEKAVIKTDADGNLIWLQEYDDPYRYSQQGNLEILSSGEMVMTYFAQPFGQNDSEPLISKLDAEGNMLWSTKPYDQADNLTPLANFIGKPLQNGNIVVMASRRYPEGIGALALALILLDTEGNVLEEKLLYTGGAAHFLFHMSLTPEGDILIAGEYESVQLSDGTELYAVPWLMKFSPDLELIWERFLVSEERGNNGIFWLDDMEVADDGRIVFGITTVEEAVVGTEPSKPGILILDEDGCYVESCTSDLQFIITDVADILPLQDKVNLFPNPSAGTLSLSISESVNGSISLYGLSGRLLHQEDFNGSDYEAAFNTLQNGMYFVTLEDEQGHLLFRERWVIMR